MTQARFSPDECQIYQQQGYFFPKRLFPEHEAEQWHQELLELEKPLVEAQGEGFFRSLPANMGQDEHPHPFEEWVRRIVWDERLIQAVADLVPGDLLLRNVDLFVKEPHTKQGLLWHMDTEYGGEDPDGIVTAWIALTRSRYSNGSLWFAPESHRRPEISNPKDEDCAQAAQAFGSPVQVRLNPGEVSFHHGRLLHTSGANQTPSRRIGLAIRFFGSDVDPRVAKCGKPVFVTGSPEKKRKSKENRAFPFTWWPPFDNK